MRYVDANKGISELFMEFAGLKRGYTGESIGGEAIGGEAIGGEAIGGEAIGGELLNF